ncbi:Bacteriophytochrome [Palleronia abyssalis]|uniref:histidine kinase n=1 Tax=Palleronia abyssalis TaxID=1501240 RepID=A0A2R8BVM3_9RHOB|nr:Bacteriophytochrome [Palleronia abyssalis]
MGHDLRNPIGAVSAGLRMLSQDGTDARRAAILIPEMQRSLTRANQIITNLMDFARGRLGGGIEIVAPRPVDLDPVFRGVANEISQFSTQPIECMIDLPQQIRADPMWLGQLLSNLLGNAVTHGEPGKPIRLEAMTRDGMLRVAVTNQGEPIADADKASLFQPVSRGRDTESLQGLGRGLYIASEIARAHDGRIDLESSVSGSTTFAFTMPARR